MPAQTKPPGQRRRRNAGQSQWEELPAAGRKGPAPKPRTDRELGPVALRYWKELWKSPMAVAFIDADIQPLTRLAVLVDDRARAESADGLLGIVESCEGGEVKVIVGQFSGDAEIRQLEDRYGVSPKARRALQWEIKQGEVVKHPTAGRSRRKLRAVDSA
jgi:hypothetical protein